LHPREYQIVQAYYTHRYRIRKDEIKTAFDHLFKPDEKFHLGQMTGVALHLPGHTADHGGHKLGDNVFMGDCMFNADVGRGRCDFPGGDVQSQFQSMQRLLSFPPEKKLYTGHDYPPAPTNQHPSRNPLPYSTVAEEKEKNKYLEDDSWHLSCGEISGIAGNFSKLSTFHYCVKYH
jgi:glyoxylase-like metal-dependent hydrolase (beta-lactamase superfamily II)